jgi:hypothetical protein
MIGLSAPEHMDKWSRNERLYRHLLGLGLVVDPVFEDDDRTQIDYLVVSSVLPSSESGNGIAKQAAVTGVVSPMEGTKVGVVVATAQPQGDRVVVDFPPILGRSVPVVAESDREP